MPTLPSKEADILALARQMVAGYQSHAADFPSINGILLNIICNFYANTRKDQIDARSRLLLATDNKNASFDTLRELMKNCLKKSQVDVAGDPDKLQYIGWGPKAMPQPADPPSQPINLRPASEGPGTIRLIWDRPAGEQPIRNYVVEKRIYLEDKGWFGPWQIAGTSLDNEINLKNQPTGVQLEYRVKAVNTGGESPPSNTVAVVL